MTRLKRQLVLVVEDDPHDREIYGRVLWYNGFDVLFAHDGVEGLEMAQAHHPDLVLLDLMIPRLDGLQFCGILKDDEATSDIHVIVLSGRPEAEMGAAAREAGCCRYLEKPVSPVRVLHEVESRIGRPPPATSSTRPRGPDADHDDGHGGALSAD